MLAELSMLELAMFELPVGHVITAMSIVAMGNMMGTICSSRSSCTTSK